MLHRSKFLVNKYHNFFPINMWMKLVLLMTCWADGKDSDGIDIFDLFSISNYFVDAAQDGVAAWSVAANEEIKTLLRARGAEGDKI